FFIVVVSNWNLDYKCFKIIFKRSYFGLYCCQLRFFMVLDLGFHCRQLQLTDADDIKYFLGFSPIIEILSNFRMIFTNVLAKAGRELYPINPLAEANGNEKCFFYCSLFQLGSGL
ncbi:MAG: hypothetical protein Q8907_11070, partial [Bacteroidota bacterium]|nr:hypothetical protein [Bacteroidota bacterium]